MYEPDSQPVIAMLLAATRPSGVLSLITKNAGALAMRPALEGRWDEAMVAMSTDRTVGGLGRETRGDTIEALVRIVGDLGGRVAAWYGIRVFTDHLGDTPVEAVPYDRVLGLELAAGARDPYRGIARLLHVIVRRS